ncbi:hypothetical protein Fcan01_24169 [Folsomia candida]|uniref:Uncharacterized protein n=1 Tax=Folsomia candida TaxID=158441 RepID=A0A226D909_FOLCA|nr:hypothetical protein Fcan01_24169 [Folsomia candida]
MRRILQIQQNSPSLAQPIEVLEVWRTVDKRENTKKITLSTKFENIEVQPAILTSSPHRSGSTSNTSTESEKLMKSGPDFDQSLSPSFDDSGKPFPTTTRKPTSGYVIDLTQGHRSGLRSGLTPLSRDDDCSHPLSLSTARSEIGPLPSWTTTTAYTPREPPTPPGETTTPFGPYPPHNNLSKPHRALTATGGHTGHPTSSPGHTGPPPSLWVTPDPPKPLRVTPDPPKPLRVTPDPPKPLRVTPDPPKPLRVTPDP